jgi:hypothetical protein
MYLDDLYTIPDQPRGPAGHVRSLRLRREGPAGGLQIVGNYWDEARMLSAGACVTNRRRIGTPGRPGISS